MYFNSTDLLMIAYNNIICMNCQFPESGPKYKSGKHNIIPSFRSFFGWKFWEQIKIPYIIMYFSYKIKDFSKQCRPKPSPKYPECIIWVSRTTVAYLWCNLHNIITSTWNCLPVSESNFNYHADKGVCFKIIKRYNYELFSLQIVFRGG